MYYIDSNTYIYFDKNASRALTSKLLSVNPANIKIPAMVAAELRLGAEKSARREYNSERLERFLSLYEIVPFDDDAAKSYAKLRAELERSGQVIGANDMVIAATVLSGGGTLITRNTDEFSRITELKNENWF
ncbi:MAG: PIN domain-containing protein [Oscillospiraceae bacterium]|nr:PIN domain-containing protein [Oscillospiraceae bacterium]